MLYHTLSSSHMIEYLTFSLSLKQFMVVTLSFSPSLLMKLFQHVNVKHVKSLNITTAINKSNPLTHKIKNI